MAIPASPVTPSDEGYSELYASWQALGEPREIDNPAEGWLYKTYHPDASDRRPIFVLVCSSPTLGVDLSKRSSWRGRYALPIVDVQS